MRGKYYDRMNNEKYIENGKELTEEECLLMLWSFITDIPENEWNEFAHDIIYKNRFSSSHKVIDVIKSFSQRCTTTIKKGQKLYRARIYCQDPLREFLFDIYKNTKREKSSDIDVGFSKYYNMLLYAVAMIVEKGGSQANELIAAYDKWQRKRFKGYNASDSGAPPINKGSAGRINPERIRYLYLAEDPRTAVYEVRPTIDQHVSVATFKTKDEIKLYDFTQDIEPQNEDHFDNNYTLFKVIQQRFSQPNTGGAIQYIPTQYLGELIKQMGFDGLRYKSSLNKSGINIVLFDEKKCKAIRSDIIRVDDIELKCNMSEIYQLKEFLKPDKGWDQ